LNRVRRKGKGVPTSIRAIALKRKRGKGPKDPALSGDIGFKRAKKRNCRGEGRGLLKRVGGEKDATLGLTKHPCGEE